MAESKEQTDLMCRIRADAFLDTMTRSWLGLISGCMGYQVGGTAQLIFSPRVVGPYIRRRLQVCETRQLEQV